MANANATSTCKTTHDLLDEERKLPVQWWTILNEMRLRGELPSWVKDGVLGSSGTHQEMDEWNRARTLTDVSIGNPDNFQYEIWTTERDRLASGFYDRAPAEEHAAILRKQWPSAVVVRVACFSGKLTLECDDGIVIDHPPQASLVQIAG